MTIQTWSFHLSAEECAALLASTTLGRLGVIIDGRPEIFPVNHIYDEETGCVAFPTNTGSKLDGALHWPSVAFEIDGLESADESGWSVAVVGRAEEITDAKLIARLSRQRQSVWRPGETSRWIRIVPSKVTGRRIRAVVS
jgi:nitroimidazol reductase NimA-like FMN-containing flavoprotein (pyridoxamine 5'-phosphate oxidase superfamily)